MGMEQSRRQNARPPFDEWAPNEIQRLRDEADALERALYLYSESEQPIAHRVNAAIYKNGVATAIVRRVSKYEPAFKAFAQEKRPLSIDEMMNIARKLGFEFDRNNMRSTVFAQKKARRAQLVGDGYLWSSPDTEPAPLDQEGAGLFS